MYTNCKILVSYLLGIVPSSRKKKLINILVPQGSVLGPLIYTIYASDLPHSSRVKVLIFMSQKYQSHAQTVKKTLQLSLYRLQKWLRKWTTKSGTSVQFSPDNFQFEKTRLPSTQIRKPTTDPQQLCQVPGVFTGVLSHLDRRLTWRNNICAKGDELIIRFSGRYWLLKITCVSCY